MTTDPTTTPLDDVLHWLHALDPVTRARHLTALLDRRNQGILAAVRVAAVHEITRTTTHAAAARRIGVTPSAVNKAITQHHATQHHAGERTD